MVAARKQIEVLTDGWHRLYGESWSGVITPDAFAHPAKFSRALIRQIYKHAAEMNWIKSNDSVVDCFGGVALGAFDALRMGLNWTGCELEEKFVGFGNQNIKLWNERYSSFPQWGKAVLIQGDSRKLSEVMGEAGLCVSSPPFCDNGMGDKRTFGGIKQPKKNWNEKTRPGGATDYGNDPGNLGNMKATQAGFEMAVSSPPYIDSMERSNGIDASKIKSKHGPNSQAVNTTKYGTADGQLGSMREGDHVLCVTSPPFEAAQTGGTNIWSKAEVKHKRRFTEKSRRQGYLANLQSENKNNLANARGEDFWSASRQILEQLHFVLSPQAHAIFVVKDFIRHKQRVPFTEQWAELCEAVGFRLIHHHRAYLVEHHGTQGTFQGEDKQIETERKSFFRRLAEKKGSPRIDYESVLCFERVR